MPENIKLIQENFLVSNSYPWKLAAFLKVA